MNFSTSWLAALVSVGLISTAVAVPYPHGPAVATDLGPVSSLAENSKITVTVALTLRNADQLEKLIQAMHTPGSAQFRQFLTPAQFSAQFGPSAQTIAAVTKEFEAAGLTVTRASTAHLHVTGTPAQVEKAFAVELHSYAVAATDKTPEYVYRAPLAAPHLSASIASSVRGVFGLDTRPSMAPHLRNPLKQPLQHPSISNATSTTDPPGQWTVLDYAQYYDLNPLYEQGATGKGHTIGIVTFASFTQSDAYTYWSAVGLSVGSNRIKEVLVDGGSGAPSDDAGSDETTLDVEQSGGLATGAKIMVYEAPNTPQGGIDAFAMVIDQNRADTVSTSWGLWEGFVGPSTNINNGDVNNPITGTPTDIIQAEDDLLAQAACQGQTWFAAAGDAGAYDTSGEVPTAPSPGQPYSYNDIIVSVDDPAAERYITAGGGTTIGGIQTYQLPSGALLNIDVKQEQAWSWGYLQPLCNALELTTEECGIYPVGTGGGVSIYWNRPFYQWATPGMADTVPGQVLNQLTPTFEQLYALPARFPGRNLPDISTNADPQTGYLYYYTPMPASDGPPGFYQAGGTSFVAPELNGVANLFVQALHQRIGLFNPPMYWIALLPQARQGRNAAFHDITKGNNWYWYARPGYDQATGLGVPDWANFFDYLSKLQP